MSTKSKMKTAEIQSAFKDIFLDISESEQIELDAKILIAKFLSEIQEIAHEKGLKRKELASKIGTSASYLTQLFRGHKLINFTTLAKFQKALGIEFNVTLSNKSKIINPINDENIAEYLDKYFHNKQDGTLLKVTKLRQLSFENIDYSDDKRGAL